jgi:hypothetical protein
MSCSSTAGRRRDRSRLACPGAVTRSSESTTTCLHEAHLSLLPALSLFSQLTAGPAESSLQLTSAWSSRRSPSHFSTGRGGTSAPSLHRSDLYRRRDSRCCGSGRFWSCSVVSGQPDDSENAPGCWRTRYGRSNVSSGCCAASILNLTDNLRTLTYAYRLCVSRTPRPPCTLARAWGSSGSSQPDPGSMRECECRSI